FGVLIGAVSAVVAAAMSIPVARFLLFPLFGARPPSDWIEVGDLEAYEDTEPHRVEILVRRVDGWTASTSKRSVWVVHSGDGQLGVLSDVCPHLGCSVQWRDDKNVFQCPCHNARFGRSGDLLDGP